MNWVTENVRVYRLENDRGAGVYRAAHWNASYYLRRLMAPDYKFIQRIKTEHIFAFPDISALRRYASDVLTGSFTEYEHTTHQLFLSVYELPSTHVENYDETQCVFIREEAALVSRIQVFPPVFDVVGMLETKTMKAGSAGRWIRFTPVARNSIAGTPRRIAT